MKYLKILEGPIRINFSAQKSYQMEATFGEIRKMIGEGKPINEVQAKINGLKNELQQVLPSLVEGHQLNADSQHGVYDNQAIKPYWQQSFKTIDDLLLKPLVLMKAVILPMLKKHSNKPNTTATKTLKWKCRLELTALLKFQQQSINNSII